MQGARPRQWQAPRRGRATQQTPVFGGNPSGRGDLGAFRRRRPPCVRRVHGGVRRL